MAAGRGRLGRAALGSAGAATLIAAGVFALSVGPAPARAAEKHVFDPALSLIGGCGVTSSDNVEDPGCPGNLEKHPPEKFNNPCGVATDPNGDIYVAGGKDSFGATDGRVDIFDPLGRYFTELRNEHQPCGLAVDSAGDVYVQEGETGSVVSYTPSSYPPTAATTYGPASVVVPRYASGVAVDPSNDHVYVSLRSGWIEQLKPDGTPAGVNEIQRLAVDATGGSFNLTFFEAGSPAGTGTLNAGSPTLTALLAAAGTGTINVGSTAVTAVATTTGAFEVGRPISGPGIPAGTTITEVSRTATSGFIRLSQAATGSGTDVAIGSDELNPNFVGELIVGPGIPSGTRIEATGPGTLTLSANATASGGAVPFATGRKEHAFGTGGAATATLAAGSPTVTSLASVRGSGATESGSQRIQSVEASAGSFRRGQGISGAGIPAGTTITAVGTFLGNNYLDLSQAATASASDVALSAQDPFAKGQEVSGAGIPAGTRIETVGVGTLTLSANATASGSEVALSAGLPYDASAEALQSSLEALAPIGAGNVSVSGGPGGAAPYLIAFSGKLASTDVAQIGTEGQGLAGPGATAQLTTLTPGYDGRIGEGLLSETGGVAVYGKNHDVYVASSIPGNILIDRVYAFDGADGHLKLTLDGSNTSEGSFAFSAGRAGVGVDQANGDAYVADVFGTHAAVDRFDAQGTFIEGLKHSLIRSEPFSEVAIDSACVLHGPPLDETTTPSCQKFDPSNGYVFVTSGEVTANSHLYAFAPAGTPTVSAKASNLTDTEATLEGVVSPHGQPTTYHFEYGTADCSANPCTKVPGEDANAGSGGPLVVEEAISGLAPATSYHFRLVASYPEGTVEDKGTFTTYTSPEPTPPDGRAYELVTPPDTNGRIPTGALFGEGAVAFPLSLASPNGESVVFSAEGGALPGSEASGVYDTYRAVRGSSGWQSDFTGLSDTQSTASDPGGVSPDQEYGVWRIVGEGSLRGSSPSPPYYLRGPGGSVEPVGVGELGVDHGAVAVWITAAASHIIFATGQDNSTAVQLEPNAPPDGTKAIYDRSPGGPTHVVSLLPGEITPTANALFQGASADGTAVAFRIGTTLYERRNDEETLRVASGEATFAGISRTGERVFYLVPKSPENPATGDIFACDTNGGGCTGPESHAPIAIGSGEESTVVNVSADGSRVYFVSPKQLEGSKGSPGADNLYVWDGASVRFIATLDTTDVSGECCIGGGFTVGGLGQWTSDAVAPIQDRPTGPANDPSRTTPDGRVLLFESRAKLTSYDSGGHAEVYRYDAATGALLCLSCNPTGAPAGSDARLESRMGNIFFSLPPVNAITEIANVTSDGEEVFFQSDEPLVAADTDHTTDVYEWKAEGKGGCSQPGGCLSLISSGHSTSPNYLYAMTPSGHDVFFLTTDTLVALDAGSTPSVYDARIGGGFPEQPNKPPCQGDACQPQAIPPPSLPGAASEAFQGPGNRRPPPARCGKGRRRVKRHGHVRCVAKRHARGVRR